MLASNEDADQSPGTRCALNGATEAEGYETAGVGRVSIEGRRFDGMN
jgi:hypothetical protein